MSSPLRLELRRPRAIDAALLALAAGAALALWLSAAPRAALLGVPLLLAIAWRRPSLPWQTLVLRTDGSAAALAADGAETDVAPLRLQRRGPLNVITLEASGRMHHFLFTPGTLPRAEARRLRLWFARHRPEVGPSAAVPHV